MYELRFVAGASRQTTTSECNNPLLLVSITSEVLERDAVKSSTYDIVSKPQLVNDMSFA